MPKHKQRIMLIKLDRIRKDPHRFWFFYGLVIEVMWVNFMIIS